MLQPLKIQIYSKPSRPFNFSSPFSSSASCCNPGPPVMATSVKIAIVGDVHGDWDLEEDSKALNLLQPDLVLFTGDFGNENVELVRSISNLNFPKAAILGNHDCWRTSSFLNKKANEVHLQLECLGKQHIGYSRLDLPVLKVSVIGGRPFSHGGHKLFRPKLLYERYGVNNMEDSKKNICKAALGTPEGHYLIFLAHNGPAGLGSKMDDICGRDWVYGGGDHGDPDLAQALLELRSKKQLHIPLVVFGHMHNTLAYGGKRKMIVFGSDDTIYLNAAVVPRVKNLQKQAGCSTNTYFAEPEDMEVSTLRAFTVVDIVNGKVEKISETWVLVTSKRAAIKEENILFQKTISCHQ